MAFTVTLPGLRAHADKLPPEVAPREEYERLLKVAWRTLLDSPAGQVEADLQTFLERHPCLLPGFRSMDAPSGHGPYPYAVIRQPKLPGLTTRRPDFCWIATDSETIAPVLIEIEAPSRQWFVHKGRRRGEQHRDLVHARSQLDRWKAWFSHPDNRAAFIREYRLTRWPFEDRELVPQFVLVHGSRQEFNDNPDLNGLRRPLRSHDTFMMTFDRLVPSRDAMSFGCVEITERGYEAVDVPPTFDILLHHHLDIAGLDRAIKGCEDITDPRKGYLLDRLREARRFRAGEIPRFGRHVNFDLMRTTPHDGPEQNEVAT